jgi:hypothetical protein
LMEGGLEVAKVSAWLIMRVRESNAFDVLAARKRRDPLGPSLLEYTVGGQESWNRDTVVSGS